jgi:hypothetical protein
MVMNNELRNMWKVAFMACFNVLSQHYPGGAKKIPESLLE